MTASPPPSSDHPGVVVLGDPAAVEPPPPPHPRGRIGWPQRVAAVLSGTAAAILVAGTLLPYEFFAASSGNPMLAQRVETTSWAMTVSRSSTGIDFKDNSHPPYFGIPIFVVALALLVGIALLVQGASAARTTVIGAAIAAATVLAMLATDIASALSAYADDARNVPEITAGVGSGFWVLLAGAVFAVLAAIFACRRTSPDAETIADMDTPPMGFPAPVVGE